VRDAARASAALAVDLRGARLAVRRGAVGEAGRQPGTARIDLDLEHGAIAGPIRVTVAARGLDGRFAIAAVRPIKSRPTGSTSPAWSSATI